MAAKEEQTSTSSSSSSSSSSNLIPPEIIEIILTKLPSKSLLRFKTVCKSWNAMILDPVFAHIHLRSSKNSPNNGFVFMNRGTEISFSLVKLEGLKFHDTGAVLGSPYGSCNQNVLCECNGVLLLTNDMPMCREYALWNPSTRMATYIGFPCKNLHRKLHQYSVSHGMSYDPITDDFKVVIVAINSYRIYSCKNNSWTEKKGIGEFHSCLMGSGIFVDGVTYWVLGKRGNNMPIQLVYFDPRNDEMKRLQKPKELSGHNDGLYIKVASLRGSLCLYCKTRDDGKTKIRFWIKEKGVLENPIWTEFITIENVSRRARNFWLKLVCFVENKIVIRLNEKKYVYYNPCEKTIEEFDEREELWDGFVPYINSLLFPHFNNSPTPAAGIKGGRENRRELIDYWDGCRCSTPY